MKTLFNDGWKFAKIGGDTIPEGFDPEYAPVQLPHDWLIYNANDLYETSVGAYVKKYDFGAVTGKSIRLYFEGVYMNSTVYVNGADVYTQRYGYTSFEADISEYLHNGVNEIKVIVRHSSPNSRWYSGAGIFRDVYLMETETSYLTTDGVYFHTDKTDSGFAVTVSAEVVNPGGTHIAFELKKGDAVLYGCNVPSEENTVIRFALDNVDDDCIWDIISPNLLTLNVKLIKDNNEIDSYNCAVGLRSIEYKADSGFLLNGRNVKLNGVCLHHDLGCLGAAFNKSAARRQLQSMLDMGVNAVRTSHNPPAKAFMELCDEMGMLVNSEAFDMWERPKTQYDYARFFDDEAEGDVAKWVRRDRNHPSVIMWSVGNEIYDTHISPRGCEVAEMLHNAVRKSDPLENAPTTIGSNYMPWEGAQNCAHKVDLVGYNYLERLYEQHHKEHPDWKIYGSETTSGVKSRGVYHFPLDTAFLTHPDMQCSSLGNCRSGASADTPQKIIAYNRDIDICAGMFIWTGSDYIGEPSPYSTKNSYYGSIDTAGLRKDSYYLYKSAWTNEPVLHLMPYWDFNEGQLIDVVVYSNIGDVELFVNGRSFGKKTPVEYTVSWQIPYEKGEIRVRAVAADGKVYEQSRHSFGNSAQLVLSPDKTSIKADGEDIVFVTISTVDKEGYPVANARDRVFLKVEGGRLVGFDNGDSTDYDNYKCANRRLFSGEAVAYIASDTEAGEITVTASAEGLADAKAVISKIEGNPRQGISILENVTANDGYDKKTDIPIRNIKLTRTTGRLLTPDNNDCRISAVVFPENATYSDISWGIVTSSGIETNIAQVEYDGLKAVVKANGDGQFRLRCSAKNGGRYPQVLSEYEFVAEGFGQAALNPYKFVTGCLYNDSVSLMDEVRCGGVSITAQNNIVGFKKTDFGKSGSEEFLVRIINWHKNDPFGFRLWEGYPEAEGSRIIGSFTYQADFEWQTYKDNHYKLDERLTGEKNIYFEFDKTDLRIDFGGFEFRPELRAYDKLNAADCDLVHGDTYKIEGTAVKGIGNNVFLDFDGMDFTQGTSSVRIHGMTRHDNDSVHIHFHTDKGRIEEIVEFPGSSVPITISHQLPDIRGCTKVEFRFLPGCDFDFEWFEIERKDSDNR